MPNPIYITSTSVATSTGAWIDRHQSPFNVSVSVTGSSSGTFGYTVQYTLDDPAYLANIRSTRAPVWFNDANLAGVSSNGTTNYMFPVAGLRLDSTAVSSAQIAMCILQGGPV